MRGNTEQSRRRCTTLSLDSASCCHICCRTHADTHPSLCHTTTTHTHPSLCHTTTTTHTHPSLCHTTTTHSQPSLCHTTTTHSQPSLCHNNNDNTQTTPRFFHHSVGRRTFPVAASLLCNSLPSDIQSSPSLPAFRQHLEKHSFLVSLFPT